MSFIFAPTSLTRRRDTPRNIHIRRVYDILHVCIQRNDLKRAIRAWTILAHCKEVKWESMWRTSVQILAENLDESERTPQRIEFLRLMMHRSTEPETILKEVVLRLILTEQYAEALDDLELYLPSAPYQDNPLLHVYAGLLSVYLAQPASDNSAGQFNPSLLRNAQAYFERAKTLDPVNPMAQAFLQRIKIWNGSSARSEEEESDDDGLEAQVDDAPKTKRVRTGRN
ncbi:hypothetical protein C8R46DRAFT_1071941 [Mycena filopes]|nr:hypothetical protein C8R46DRAFT_1071941 [Mycena filopes]